MDSDYGNFFFVPLPNLGFFFGYYEPNPTPNEIGSQKHKFYVLLHYPS